jgi:hypothetical protein
MDNLNKQFDRAIPHAAKKQFELNAKLSSAWFYNSLRCFRAAQLLYEKSKAA